MVMSRSPGSTHTTTTRTGLSAEGPADVTGRNLVSMTERDMDEPVNVDSDFDEALDKLLGVDTDDDTDDDE